MTTCERVMVVVLLLAVAATGQAQDRPGEIQQLRGLSLEELGNVEVLAVSKAPETVWNTPAAIFVLTREDIQRSGATSLPDALRLVPGVEVARIDTSRNWVVGIRGFGDQFSKSVLVLIDGRSAYTPLWAGVHWPIQDTLLEDVDRIEVIRGPGGTIWGANAQNGVINIVTRHARDTQGLYASAAAGNVDQALAEVRYGGSSGSLQYRVYGKGSHRAPQFHTDGREFDTWKMGQGGFRADWERGRDTLTFQGDGYGAVLGESVLVHTFNPPATSLVDDPVDLYGINALARWHRIYSPDADLSVQGSIDFTSRMGTDFGERRTTYDLDVVHHWRGWNRHTVITGAGLRTSPSRIIQTYSFSDFTPHEHTLNTFSVFGHDAFALFPGRLSLSGGVKVERNSYTGIEVQPSGRVTWTPAANQTIWGGVTRAVRTPSRVDEDISVSLLAAVNPLIYGVISGNRDIEAEGVLGSEVGYRALVTRSAFFDIAVFRNRYDGLVSPSSATAVREAITDGVTYTAIDFPFINAADGHTSGFEIAPSWQPSARFRLRGAYSFLDIDLQPAQDAKPLSLEALEGATPRHHVNIQALITLPRGIQIDPVYRYVSTRAAQDIPGYHTADLHVRIPLTASFDFTVVGQNLLQDHHPEWARDPGPTVEIRRSVYARLVWRR